MVARKKSLVPSVGYWSTPTTRRLREDMNFLFNGFFKDFFSPDWYYHVVTFEDMQPSISFPKVDVFEANDTYNIKIVVAGFDKDDVKLVLKENCLSIEADKKEEKEEKGEGKYLKKEISSRSFRRMIRFPHEIDNEKVNANYKDGIIKVTIAKKIEKEKDKGVKVEVK